MKDILTDYVIIGGGPTGLGAAWRLQEAHQDFFLIEAESYWGGLSASFVDAQGFTWDLGGHVLFSHYDTFDRYMDVALGNDGWLKHRRESWIWLKNRFIPYPFQNNIHRLEPIDRESCLKGLRTVSSRHAEASGISNFREWLLATFGEGIANLFLLPYNFKVWAYPPELLDYHWIGERVALPDIQQIMRSISLQQDYISWGPNQTFRFPRSGGTGAIWASLGLQLPGERVRCGDPVVEIRPSDCTAVTRSGCHIQYRRMISSMPLDRLMRMVGLRALKQQKLWFSSVYVIGVGLNGRPPPHVADKCWMYFPESNSPYYRVTVFSNYSGNNVAQPESQWSLMAEVSESPMKPVDAQSLMEQTLQALHQDTLIPDLSAVCSAVIRRIPQAYPTPFLGRDAVVDPVLRELETMEIYSRGRLGAWKYEVGNMDHSFAQGYECASRLLQGGGSEWEPTLQTPSLVNSRRNP